MLSSDVNMAVGTGVTCVWDAVAMSSLEGGQEPCTQIAQPLRQLDDHTGSSFQADEEPGQMGLFQNQEGLGNV